MPAFSRLIQVEHSYFGSHGESYLEQMTHTPINIHAAASSQRVLPRFVAPILDRQQWGRKKRRLALPTVRVPRQNPPCVRPPNRMIGRVGIVAKDQGGSSRLQISQASLGIKAMRPEIIHANNLQTVNLGCLVAKDMHARCSSQRCDLIRHLGMRPPRTVVM